MIYHNGVRLLHIEASSRCNAACPQCARNVFGGKTQSWLKLADLTKDDYKKIFSKKIGATLKEAMFCGTHGDPIISKYLFDGIELCRQTSNAEISIYTNGGIRNDKFWKTLAGLLDPRVDYVGFGIDGLEDTNHLYRRNVKWEKLMNNIKVFIDNGGIAKWDFLVYKHNEHQIEEAQQIAKDMGFKRFRLRKTSKFEGKESFPVKNKLGEIIYHLEPPTDKKLRNDQDLKMKKVFEKYGGFTNYMKKVPIACKAERLGELYVSATGLVWPCSYLYGGYYGNPTGYARKELDALYEKYGKDFNKLSSVDIIDEIVEHEWISTDLKPSFDDETRLLKCGRTCGIDYDPIHSQSERIEI